MSTAQSSDLAAQLAEIVDPGGELGTASAVRLRARLQPAGGRGTKLMPPTYAGPNGPVYVAEERVIDGDDPVPCVSLDSVASQANRMEEALAEAIEDGRATVPTIWVDQGEFGVNSALNFSHRTFDAWIEDALLDGKPFRDSELWPRLAGSKRRDLTALMEHSPTSILLGSWASRSKNPQGATRLPRVLTSEIVGVGAVAGQRASSRIDIHQVSAAIKTYAGDGDKRFAIDESEAAVDEKGKPRLAGEGDKRGRPSALGYGNVTPSLAQHGGVTVDYALQIATISLPAIRECRLPRDGNRDRERDVAGRVMLLALGLRMLALQVEHGYDLRSGCLLVPEQEPTFELLDSLGQTTESWPVLASDTETVLADAIEAGKAHGIDWTQGSVNLTASPEQIQLLEASLAAEAADDGQD